jgi:hypothetical protein
MKFVEGGARAETGTSQPTFLTRVVVRLLYSTKHKHGAYNYE